MPSVRAFNSFNSGLINLLLHLLGAPHPILLCIGTNCLKRFPNYRIHTNRLHKICAAEYVKRYFATFITLIEANEPSFTIVFLGATIITSSILCQSISLFHLGNFHFSLFRDSYNSLVAQVDTLLIPFSLNGFFSCLRNSFICSYNSSEIVIVLNPLGGISIDAADKV